MQTFNGVQSYGIVLILSQIEIIPDMILIVMPILALLMFLLGLGLKREAFRQVAAEPLSLVVGLVGQIIFLPLCAFAVASLMNLPPIYFIGLMLVAASPGGSSSNVFTMLAKGNVALSITLTAISSIITLFTIPFILEWVCRYISAEGLTESAAQIHLPAGKLIIQNIVLLLLPIMVGVALQRFAATFAAKCERALSKIAFPALMLLAALFFLQYTKEIVANFATLGLSATALILLAIILGWALAKLFRFSKAVQRTINIEIGMQNAAQAIAIATSPFIFDNGEMALPAIIYALVMNIVLLAYVALIRARSARG